MNFHFPYLSIKYTRKNKRHIMKTIKLSHILNISALSLTLGLVSGIASAGDSSKYDAENDTHMESQPSQQHSDQAPSEREEMDSTTRSGADEMDDTVPAGTDATRSVPGAPEAGTNPATEPGTGTN